MAAEEDTFDLLYADGKLNIRTVQVTQVLQAPTVYISDTGANFSAPVTLQSGRTTDEDVLDLLLRIFSPTGTSG